MNWKLIALWALRVLIAALFLFAGFMKLSSNPDMVAEFSQIGLGDGFRYLTGVIELAGGVALLIPAVSLYGAAILLCVDVGAGVAQLAVLHKDIIHVIVIAVAIVGVIYLGRGARK